MRSGRDYIQISEAARILGVTEQTLRNWDQRGKLSPQRHPINGYRMYRVSQIHSLLRANQSAPVQGAFLLGEEAPVPGKDSMQGPHGSEVLPACHWSAEVALDPKHRPQHWNKPSSTVRRDWKKYPQEAHVIDAAGKKYRRLTVDEIAILQGFDPAVAHVPGMTDRQRIAALGDAVPPPLSRALLSGINEVWEWSNRTALEICAGIGGLAEGSAAIGLDHRLLIDFSSDCGRFLANRRPWPADRVRIGDARSVAYEEYSGGIGLMSGGPPCQPWSQAGARLGHSDQRDLLGGIHKAVGLVRPEVFLFENVPGLARGENRGYLDALVKRLTSPADGLNYGVMVAHFNAADFGVPQSRERIFVLGLRNSPASRVMQCFDRASAKQTHSRAGSRPWVTVGEAIGMREDPGGWRRWIGN